MQEDPKFLRSIPVSDLASHYKEHPRHFKKEVYNAAPWMFLPATSLGTGRASKFLGIAYHTLLRYADTFGLTVMYRNCRGSSGRVDRFFLVSELKDLKQKLESVTMKDALRSAEDQDGYFKKARNRKTKIRAESKSHTG